MLVDQVGRITRVGIDNFWVGFARVVQIDLTHESETSRPALGSNLNDSNYHNQPPPAKRRAAGDCDPTVYLRLLHHHENASTVDCENDSDRIEMANIETISQGSCSRTLEYESLALLHCNVPCSIPHSGDTHPRHVGCHTRPMIDLLIALPRPKTFHKVLQVSPKHKLERLIKFEKKMIKIEREPSTRPTKKYHHP